VGEQSEEAIRKAEAEQADDQHSPSGFATPSEWAVNAHPMPVAPYLAL
jgi:hypothetical protein